MRRDVLSGKSKLYGAEHYETLNEALNYAASLVGHKRCERAKVLMRITLPVTQRVYCENHELTLRMRCIYATALFMDSGATLGDLREAVTTLAELVPTARRVLGGAHPVTVSVEGALQLARESLRARESTGDVESLRAAVEAMTPG